MAMDRGMPIKASGEDWNVVLVFGHLRSFIPYIVKLERVHLVVAFQRKTGQVLSNLIS